ncbi:methyl-accepting chemotaxis protein [Pseudoflavonifractor phocaeensis]|uniref:methyl-accepting chemotaxis protein n=1 Tax=Pseudoflavonifractor phocaeensis TaxID=1870988 RepID=UPI001957BC8C|nr:methyl-accepting chemotaxis protein [Pseudoflavonifractor phocaeensis]MBM6724463.1 hypothetical protein [Pseudoflavonifractor phocaeensis]
MIDQMKILRVCSIIVSAVLVLYAGIYALSGRWQLVAILLVMGALLLLPCRFLARPETIGGLSAFMMIWIDVMVFVTQLFSRELAPGTALYICSIALSALFLSRPLLRLCCISSGVLFIVECGILSLQQGQPVEAPLVLGECLLAIFVAYILLDQCVKNCNFYLEEANTQKDASTRLLSELDEKQKQNQQVLDRQQLLLTQIVQVSAQISREAKSLADQSENLATGSTSQAASIANVSTAAEEIYQQISETAGQATEVRNASEAMRRNAGDGNTQVQDLLAAISDIEASVQSIESAVNIIQSLAFQTNILALNAAVEAARAGSSGKGFAVVADEVRSLASNSSEAAQQIIKVLSACREAVSRGSTVAANTSAVMGRIRQSVEQVADQSVRISERTEAQLEAVNGIKEDLGRVSDVVQSNAAASQECSAMVRELSEQAHMLDQLSKT